MKKNLGSKLALYPMPLVVIGTMNGEKPTWTLVAHTGIIGHNNIMVSLFEKHFINELIKKNQFISINLVNQEILTRADYCGITSGVKKEKGEVFEYCLTENKVPIINDSPLVLECKVEQNLSLANFDNFICSIASTNVEENCLTNDNIDYLKISPVLFDMPNYGYYRIGEYLGKGATFGKKYENSK